MDLYGFSLALGAAGLAAMGLGGLSHAGHDGHAGLDGHAGHDTGHPGLAGHDGHTGSHDASHALVGQHAVHHEPPWFQALLSPRVLFALLVGFGAGGTLAAPLGEPWRAGAAIVAAAAFESFLVGPLWRLLFRFESTPATTLDSSIEDEARAVTGFDADGNGLVSLDVDGQIVQLLGTLSAEDRARGVRIRTGDLLMVSSVDAARNRCVVRPTDR
jgi:hypothetical protein